MYNTDFPNESSDALKMIIRPSDRSAGAPDMVGLLEFNRPIERWGRRGTIHGVLWCAK